MKSISILLFTLGFAAAASIPVTDSKITDDLLLAGIVVRSESSSAADTFVISQNTTATKFGTTSLHQAIGTSCTLVTGDSPLVQDVKRLSTHLRGEPKTEICRQDYANGCNRIISAGTASASFCGPVGSQIVCNYLGWSIDQVIQHCTVGDKVQGSYRYDDVHTSHVHRS